MFKEGSYKKHKKLSPHEYRLSDDYIDSLTNDFNLESKLITGSAGTIILSDTRGIHRGHPIKNSNRYALTNYYIQESHFNPDKAI